MPEYVIDVGAFMFEYSSGVVPVKSNVAFPSPRIVMASLMVELLSIVSVVSK